MGRVATVLFHFPATSPGAVRDGVTLCDLPSPRTRHQLSPHFIIDTQLQRDALYAGIWTRLCCELRGHADGHHLWEYIKDHAVTRGEPGPSLFDYLDQDIKHLLQGQADLRSVANTPLGDDVELDDVVRFMPVGWKEDGPTGPGRWVATDSEAKELDAAPDETVRRVRRVMTGDA
jgi:hypothetical protein